MHGCNNNFFVRARARIRVAIYKLIINDRLFENFSVYAFKRERTIRKIYIFFQISLYIFFLINMREKPFYHDYKSCAN